MKEVFFDEILQYHHSTLTLKERYTRLYDLLDRMCKQLTEEFDTDFSNLFSRLYALCKHTNFHRNAIENFRQHARRIIRNEEEPNEERYPYDLKALCEAISHFYHTSIPASLSTHLPDKWRSLTPSIHLMQSITKRVRFIVDHWDKEYIYGFCEMSDNDMM